MGTRAPEVPTIVPLPQNAPFHPCQRLVDSGRPLPVGRLGFCWGGQCWHLLPMPGGQRGMWGAAPAAGPPCFPQPKSSGAACSGWRGSGAVGGAQGLQRGLGAPAETGRALAGGRKLGGGLQGCTAGRTLVPSFPPLLTGCKVPGIPLRGGSRSHPLPQGAEGSQRCQAAGGE